MNKIEQGIILKLWWQSRELWNYALGMVGVIVPLILNGIGALNLTPLQLLYWTVGLNVVNYTAGALLKLMSRTVVVTKPTREDMGPVIELEPPVETSERV